MRKTWEDHMLASSKFASRNSNRVSKVEKLQKNKENKVMRTEDNTLDAEVIEHFMRKARVERSLAVAAMTRQAVDSVKNIFSSAGAGETADSCC